MHASRITRAMVAGAVLLGVLLSGTSPAAAYSDEDVALALTNQARADVGVAPLGWHPYLDALAQDWADTQAYGGFLAHNRNLPNQMWDWWEWGENIGYGWSMEQLHGMWMESRRHYANLVDGAFTSVGVGIAYFGDGSMIVVLVFGG